MKNLTTTLDQIERVIRANHEAEIKSDPKGFRKTLIHWLTRSFPLTRGRRREQHLDRAERLRGSGLTWNEVAALVNPDYQFWDAYRKLQYRHTLESGIRRRKHRAKLMERTNHAADISASLEKGSNID